MESLPAAAASANLSTESSLSYRNTLPPLLNVDGQFECLGPEDSELASEAVQITVSL